MFRRSLLQISTRRLCNIRRSIPLPRQINSQGHSVRGFSTTPPQRNDNGRGSAKVFFGSVAIGAGSMALYLSGYLDPYLGREPKVSVHSANEAQGGKGEELIKQSEASTNSGSDGNNPISFGFESAEKSNDSLTEPPLSEVSRKTDEESNVSVHGGEELSFPNSSNGNPTAEPVYAHFDSSEKDVGMETLEENTKEEQLKGSENAPIISHATAISQESGTEPQVENPSTESKPEDVQIHEEDPPHSLLDEYNLKNVAEVKTAERPESGISSTEKAPIETTQDMDDLNGPNEDENLILNLLQVIKTTEKRQAELDARIHSEEKRTMKEKYDKELKDARARELMYAEEVAMLEKDIKKEKAKATVALKALRENAEERLKMELESKEKEAESKLTEVQEFAKAELAAAIAREKAAQIENMAEANVNINALCMAFYARSEEARQTHSVHKLALGALALKDALSKGRPIQPEVVFIRENATTDVDNDLLLDLVLSSLPEEIQSRGTDTPLQLNQKFDDLKDTLRHYSLLPPDGGGILAHSLAYVASFLKVREADKSGNGIESIINRVQSLLAEGKLVEAADFLESGVQGSEAVGVVGEWVKQARNRAITEQALMLVQSYTTCASLT